MYTNCNQATNSEKLSGIHREALHAITGHRAPEDDDVESRLFGRRCLLYRPTDPKMDDDNNTFELLPVL
jgi:hypothetical protein